MKFEKINWKSAYEWLEQKQETLLKAYKKRDMSCMWAKLNERGGIRTSSFSKYSKVTCDSYVVGECKIDCFTQALSSTIT